MFLKLYITALVIFFGFDMIWLGLVAKDFYASQIGFLMRPDINWAAAILFYLLFIGGLVTFVIAPAVESSSPLKAAALGAFFGFITYATYDLTNLATLKDWPLLVTIVDLAWGSVLGAVVSSSTTLIYLRFFK